MSNKVVNSLLVISALAFASLLTGCGKSKETKPQTAPPTEQGTPAPGGGRPTDRTPTTGDGTKAPVPANPPAPTQPPVNPPTTPPPPKQPPVVTNPPAPTQPQMPPNLSNSNERVNFAGDATKTGGLKAAGQRSTEMYYSGSSDDQLLETLLVQLQFKSDAERSVDMQIARDIKFAKLSVDRNSGKRTLSISTDEEDARAQTFQLVESDQNRNFLLPKQDPNKMITGFVQPASAELICMDQVPAKDSFGIEQCLVTVAKVQFGNGQAHIIFRKNHALVAVHSVINTQELETDSISSGFKMWRDYLHNRIDQVITDQKMEEVIVSSFEVVGGKSEMGVVFVAKDGSSAGLRVPLLVGARGSAVNVAAYENNNIDARFDFSTYKLSRKIKSTVLGDVIQSARLTKNNGRGDVEVTLTFDKRAKNQDPEDQTRMHVVISRNNQIIDLNKLSQSVN